VKTERDGRVNVEHPTANIEARGKQEQDQEAPHWARLLN